MMKNKWMIVIAVAVFVVLGASVFFIVKNNAGTPESESGESMTSDEKESGEDEKESGSETEEKESETVKISGGVESADFDETESRETTTSAGGGNGNHEATTSAGSGNESQGTADASGLTFNGTAKEYEIYSGLSSQEQYDIFIEHFGETLEGVKAYVAWFNAAKNAYQKEHPHVVLEEGIPIDLGK